VCVCRPTVYDCKGRDSVAVWPWRRTAPTAASDIRISNQFLISCDLHFAQPRCTTTPTVLSTKRNYHIGSQSIILNSQALETFKLYSATQCDSDSCLIIRLLCKMESTSNHKLVADSNIASGYCRPGKTRTFLWESALATVQTIKYSYKQHDFYLAFNATAAALFCIGLSVVCI